MSMIQDFRKRFFERRSEGSARQTVYDFSSNSSSYFAVMWDRPQTIGVDGERHIVYPTYLLKDRSPSGVSGRDFVSPSCKAGDFGPLVESADCLRENGWGDASCVVFKGASVSGVAFIGDNTVVKNGANVGGFSYVRDCDISGNARVSDSYVESSRIGGNSYVSLSYVDSSHIEGNSYVLQARCSQSSMFDNSKCESSEMTDVTLWGNSEVKNHSEIKNHVTLYGSSMVDGSKVEGVSELRDVDVRNGSEIIKSQIAGGKFLNSYVYKTLLNVTGGRTYNRQTFINGEIQAPKGMKTDTKTVASDDYDSKFEPLIFD